MAAKPLRADAQRNRDAIVSAARAAYLAGEDGIRFDDFAALAGVGTGTLYRHFPTREALAAAVFAEEAHALAARARELVEHERPDEALGVFLREFVDYLDRHRGLAQTLARSVGAKELAAGGQDLESAVTALLSRAAAAGAIRADVPAGAVMLALHGITTAHDRDDWRAEADGTVTLLLDGLRVWVVPPLPSPP